jgi:hypothetical protein
MKIRVSFLTISVSLAGLVGCQTQPPIVVERHHYYPRTQTRYVPTYASPQKASPSAVGSGGSESFRAVEKPSSYSQ